MTTEQTAPLPLTQVYDGWARYQGFLVNAVAPLSAEQLALRPAPHLRTVMMLVKHIIGARARWFLYLGEEVGGAAHLAHYDGTGPHQLDETPRSAAELVEALEASWQMLYAALSRWTTADLAHLYTGTHRGEAYTLTRQWVLWHLIEHDMHHGGELSFLLGMHGIPAIDL
jgi:uncharacterized damage-inducible protein DinB